MRFARWSFGLAAAYGLAATLPQYAGPPLAPDTLWRHAFAGAAAATQLLYAAIAIDPRRYRPLIPIGIASKVSFALPVLILAARGQAGALAPFAAIDLALAALFAINFRRLRDR